MAKVLSIGFFESVWSRPALTAAAALSRQEKALVIVAQTVVNRELPPERRVHFRVSKGVEEGVSASAAAI